MRMAVRKAWLCAMSEQATRAPSRRALVQRMSFGLLMTVRWSGTMEGCRAFLKVGHR